MDRIGDRGAQSPAHDLTPADYDTGADHAIMQPPPTPSNPGPTFQHRGIEANTARHFGEMAASPAEVCDPGTGDASGMTSFGGSKCDPGVPDASHITTFRGGAPE